MKKSIEISVKNRVAWQTNTNVYICGNGDFEVVFAFDPEWDRYETKTARFVHDGKNTDVVFNGNKCTIPKTINATRLEVGVYAGELYATTPAVVRCVRSILCNNGAPADPLPDVYAQIMEMLTGYTGDASGIMRVESLEETGLRNLRELESGTYILYGYFTPYPGAEDSITIDNCIAAVVHMNAGSHVMVYNPRNFKIECFEILEEDGYTYNRDIISLLDLRTNKAVRIAEIALLAANWKGNESPYSQIVEIPGVTEYSQVDLTPSVEQLSVFYNKDLTFVTENEGGVVTVYAIGQKPENDYEIQATIKEVSV